MNLSKLVPPACLFAAAALLVSQPAVAQDEYAEDQPGYTNPDPWEPVNRVVFSFNDTVDRFTLKPLARVYDTVTPDVVDDGVSNFFANLAEPKNLVNNTLQGKFRDAGVDTARFLFNTTLGLGGVFDVATRMGLQRNDEDLGQTIGSWGVASGPYVVLPLLGPSTVRDGLARVPESMAGYTYPGEIDHVPTRNVAFGTDLVDTRAALLSQERLITGDRYRFIRNAYLQNREYKVSDGVVVDDF